MPDRQVAVAHFSGDGFDAFRVDVGADQARAVNGARQ